MIAKTITLIVLTFLLNPLIACAESIQLKSGETIEGEIIARTDEYIKIDLGIGMVVTYYLDEIDHFDGKPPTISESATVPAQTQKDSNLAEEKPSQPPTQTTEIKRTPNLKNKKTSDHAERDLGYEQYLMRELQKNPSPEKRTVSKKSPKENIEETEFEHDVKLWMQKFLDIFQKVSREALTISLNTLRANTQFQKLAEKYGEANVILATAGALYSLFCFPFMIIVHRNYLSGLMAWVPIVQLSLLVRLAEKPIWWFLLLFIPIVNLLIFVALWMNIARLLQKPSWLGILMIVPGVNLIILWYFAFAR